MSIKKALLVVCVAIMLKYNVHILLHTLHLHEADCVTYESSSAPVFE